MLDALHRAQRDELRGFVDSLPIAPGDRVLDVACGDGTFTSWLAERCGLSMRDAKVALTRAHADASELSNTCVRALTPPARPVCTPEDGTTRDVAVPTPPPMPPASSSGTPRGPIMM